MEFRILSATFFSPISQGPQESDTAFPFSNQTRIDFSDAIFDELHLQCDCMHLYDLRQSDKRQSIIEDTVLGGGLVARTFPAREQLSLGPVSLLRDGDGNQFYAFFPIVRHDHEKLVQADHHTVLIVPKCHQSDCGQIHWPVFRSDVRYDCCGHLQDTADARSIPLDPWQGATACLAKGTFVLTTEGMQPVETLRPGALIHSRDHGAQRLRWVGRAHLEAGRLQRLPHLRPIRISAGSLGKGLPTEDLIVAPQHRVLVSSSVAQRMVGASEVLIAARHLVGLPGIEAASDLGEMTYTQLLLDRHELILTNGAWTESLYADAQSLASLPWAARSEVMAIFPELHPAPARSVASETAALSLIAHHVVQGRTLVETC